jgi:pimeloyl-ACP methyl ester carboxylesterase
LLFQMGQLVYRYAPGKMIPAATTVVFPTCDHWLYIEDWSYFSKLVLDFAANGRLTSSK